MEGTSHISFPRLPLKLEGRGGGGQGPEGEGQVGVRVTPKKTPPMPPPPRIIEVPTHPPLYITVPFPHITPPPFPSPLHYSQAQPPFPSPLHYSQAQPPFLPPRPLASRCLTSLPLPLCECTLVQAPPSPTCTHRCAPPTCAHVLPLPVRTGVSAAHPYCAPPVLCTRSSEYSPPLPAHTAP